MAAPSRSKFKPSGGVPPSLAFVDVLKVGRRDSDRMAARIADAALPPRKPMAMTRRVSLFERDIHVRLATAAVDILMDGARVLSEGEVTGGKFAGSTMVTIDLEKSKHRVSDPLTAATATRVAALYTDDDRARAKARRLATSEARRTAKCELMRPQVDVEASAVGTRLHLSINVEADQRKECP
jgi:hypothetical protein